MATKYWVGGAAIGTWTSSNTTPWRSTPGASFSGTQSGYVVTFSNLKGTIDYGHYVYVTAIASAIINSAITYTNSPTNTAGYFNINTPRTLTARAMCTASSNVAVSAPSTLDTVIFDAGSAYTSSIVNQSLTGPYTITNLNMDGFRGVANNFGENGIYYMKVTGTITWPYNTGASIDAWINLASGTIINNNGNTNLANSSELSGVNYLAESITVPANVLAYRLTLNGAVNLSNRTIAVENLIANVGTTLTPGTSTVKCTYFTSASANAKTLNNVETVAVSYTNVFYSDVPGLVVNSLTATTFTDDLGGSSFGDVYLDNTTVKYINVQNPNFSIGGGIYSSSGTPVTVTKSGGGSVMLQVLGVGSINFSPANTFFSVGMDFTDPVFASTNIRPSPSPLNFV